MKSQKSFLVRKGGKMLMLIFIGFLGLISITIFYLILISPGQPATLRDKKGNFISGSISEKIFIRIGEVNQGMFILSKNIENPVLLYIHGGPGFPNYFLIEKYKPGLEDFFTVCYWEQRGGGLSYTPEVTIESMTLDQLTCDAIEVSNYLRKRFGKEKIYILAHSGGTAIALPAVSRAPELYHAYIAMAQMTNQLESEKIAYDFILNHYTELANHRAIRKLKKFHNLDTESDIFTFYHSVIRDKTMHDLGVGTMRVIKSVFKDIFVPVWACRAYTFIEKINIWKSKLLFLPKTIIGEETLKTDFSIRYTEIDVPVYFISGKYDLTVNIDLSRKFYKHMKAPLKKFYTFENSAHSPLFEEIELFRNIIQKDVLGSSEDRDNLIKSEVAMY